MSYLVSAQVQKNFFVEDANGVDFVRVSYCVNNEAKIDEVKVIPEMTTYKNNIVIEELKIYLLSIEYYSDSKLKNNCYKTTFTFINSKYENDLENNKKLKIKSSYLKGNYKYKNPVYQGTKIKRGKRKQREIGVKYKQIYFIEWLSDIKYKLVYKRMTEKRFKHLIGNEIIVNIIDILPDNSYVYKAKADQNQSAVYGVIKKVK